MEVLSEPDPLICPGGHRVDAVVGQDGAVTPTVRRLEPSDRAAALQLSYEAFGVPTTPIDPASPEPPGRLAYGAFDGDTLTATMVDRDFDSCFGGVALPTCGIAGVTVAAEYRGRGGLTPLFTETLRGARERGAVISGLYPTAPRIYRRFGYEVVATFDTVAVPALSLAAVGPVDGVTTRRATVADIPAVQQIYDEWAVGQNGPLTRRGVSFPAGAEEILADYTGVSVAEDDDGICGWASWDRGQGYDAGASLAVSDLLARNAAGYRALLRMAGSFATVTPTVKIDTSGDDLIRTFVPTLHWSVVKSSPYMIKIIDVPAALDRRRYPPGLSTELTFRLDGDFLPENNGAYALRVRDGVATCERTASSDRSITPQGLALSYAGAQSSANLRAAGHLSGGRTSDDLDWDALFSGRQRHIRDYY